MAEHDSQEKEEDLKNAKIVVVEFKRRINTEVRKQERLEIVDKKELQKRRVTREVYGKNVVWVE